MQTELQDCKQLLVALTVKYEYLQQELAELLEEKQLLQAQLEARHVNG